MQQLRYGILMKFYQGNYYLTLLPLTFQDAGRAKNVYLLVPLKKLCKISVEWV